MRVGQRAGWEGYSYSGGVLEEGTSQLLKGKHRGVSKYPRERRHELCLWPLTGPAVHSPVGGQTKQVRGRWSLLAERRD